MTVTTLAPTIPIKAMIDAQVARTTPTQRFEAAARAIQAATAGADTHETDTAICTYFVTEATGLDPLHRETWTDSDLRLWCAIDAVFWPVGPRVAVALGHDEIDLAASTLREADVTAQAIAAALKEV